MPHRVDIHKQSRVFDDVFKVDEVLVSYEKYDGTMSADARRLVFERGDSVAALLHDLDARCVVLTEQFKLPAVIGRKRDKESTTNGWILETVAGMIEADETPDAAIIRETLEETGYHIRNPRLIAKFFSSPGGTSERVFLFYAKVRESDKRGAGGGVEAEHEDIRVVRMPLEDLFDRMENASFEDPKLIIGAFWLRGQLAMLYERERIVRALEPQGHSARTSAPSTSEPLDFSTVQYTLKARKDLIIGYKTGPIQNIKGIPFWVNSENTDMMMDRFIGKTISARIRFLGANKDEHGDIVEDTIAEALMSAIGRRSYVKIGTVLMTESGMLRSTHQVRNIFHVAVVEGGPGAGVKADPAKLGMCQRNVLARADEENSRFWTSLFNSGKCDSILVPMLGSGDGGIPVDEAAYSLISTALSYFRNNSSSTLKEIYFLAFRNSDRTVCDHVFEQFCSEGVLLAAGKL